MLIDKKLLKATKILKPLVTDVKDNTLRLYSEKVGVMIESTVNISDGNYDAETIRKRGYLSLVDEGEPVEIPSSPYTEPIEISINDLRKGLANASDDELRIALCSIFVNKSDSSVVATNSLTLFHSEHYDSTKLDIEDGLLLSKDFVKILLSLVSKTDTSVKCRYNNTAIEATLDEYVITGRFINGRYPTVPSIIPDESSKVVTVIKEHASIMKTISNYKATLVVITKEYVYAGTPKDGISKHSNTFCNMDVVRFKHKGLFNHDEPIAIKAHLLKLILPEEGSLVFRFVGRYKPWVIGKEYISMPIRGYESFTDEKLVEDYSVVDIEMIPANTTKSRVKKTSKNTSPIQAERRIKELETEVAMLRTSLKGLIAKYKKELTEVENA